LDDLSDRSDRLNGAEPGFLTDEEQLRLGGFRFEKRRQEWLLGRWTAKQLLRRCRTIEIDAVQIRNEAGGKPYFVDLQGEPLPVCLTISHRAGRAFCALTFDPGVAIGADLEVWEPRDAIFIDDYLAKNEQDLAMACTGERRDLTVTLMWSAKEAVFKALGTGLRMDTRSVAVGGLDWLVKGDAIPAGWLALVFDSKVAAQPMRGWWRLEGDLILTCAVLGDVPVELTAI
jgi:4'-phosphopantetheinyl transferase